jgi:hypothetical protein
MLFFLNERSFNHYTQLARLTRWFIKPGVSPGTRQNRLRQHGTCLPCSQKNSLSEFFCEQETLSSALPEPALSVVEWGDIRDRTCDRRIHISSGRFAGFVHVAVFVVQTPTTYVV